MGWWSRAFCPHKHRYRERDKRGVLQLVCDRCGDKVVAIRRDARERSVARRLAQRIANRQGPAVTPFGRRKKA